MHSIVTSLLFGVKLEGISLGNMKACPVTKIEQN